jgi:hypothetical protein
VSFRKLIVGGIREEDLVIFLDYLLASAHLERHEVAAYSPIIQIIPSPVDGKIRVFLVSSKGTDSVTLGVGREVINQSYPSKPNLATLSASSSAVTHVGPGQVLLSLLVPLQ